MKLKTRKIIGTILKEFALGYSSCQRCGIPWKFTKSHSTRYNETKGCFPLCEDCWKELTPKERFPFYMDLILKWEFDSILERAKVEKQIQRAVLDGK